MNQFVNGCLVIVLASALWASETVKEISAKEAFLDQGGGVQPLMRDLLSELSKVSPFMNSEKAFKDRKNETEISKGLKKMADLAKRAAHEPRLKLPNYRISREVLESHIKDTERIFRSGNKSYARWMLNSTKNVCLSCHAQLPGYSRSSWNVNEPESFVSPFQQAEFEFTTHNFDAALQIFDGVIDDYPNEEVTRDELQTAFERKLAYYARIKRDPKKGLKSLEQDLENEKLPESTVKNVKAWIALFREWSKEEPFNPSTATSDKMVAYAKSNLTPELWDKLVDANDPRVVTYLKISGMLYEFMASHPDSPATPEILYMLAKCDRALNNNFFFSLADIYLKECMIKYPKSSIAKSCFRDFEENTIVSYSGSGGTRIPSDVQKELDRLRERVGASKKGRR